MQKGIYSYECINDWEKFYETFSPEKEEFYSHLTMEGITHADCAYAKRVCKNLEIRSLGKYPDLYVLCDTVLLADVSSFKKD